MPEQKRNHLRFPLETRTFIELVSPLADDSEPGKLATCETLDISRGGLQVLLEEEVPVGAILQIGVDLPGSEDTLYLAGEVRWCLQTRGKQYPWAIGFQILNSAGSDIERWIALLATMDS